MNFEKYLVYRPRTGSLIWIKPTSNRVSIGDIAGWIGKLGYRYVTINGKDYKAHRVAYYLKTGELPPGLDHKNGIKNDNRWINLRKATSTQNARNRSRVKRATMSNLKGVVYRANRKGWVARIGLPGRRLYLGQFNTREEAHNTYCNAARKHFGNFARFE